MPHQNGAYSFLIPQFSTDPGWDTNSLKFGGTLRIESHRPQTHTFCSRSVQQTILCSLFFAKKIIIEISQVPWLVKNPLFISFSLVWLMEYETTSSFLVFKVLSSEAGYFNERKILSLSFKIILKQNFQKLLLKFKTNFWPQNLDEAFFS